MVLRLLLIALHPLYLSLLLPSLISLSKMSNIPLPGLFPDLRLPEDYYNHPEDFTFYKIWPNICYNFPSLSPYPPCFVEHLSSLLERTLLLEWFLPCYHRTYILLLISPLVPLSLDLSSPPPVLSHWSVFPVSTMFYYLPSVSFSICCSLVHACWSTVYKLPLYHLYSLFLICAIQAYI